MTRELQQRVKAHGLALLEMFPHASEQDPIQLCRKLRRLEAKANRSAVARCNGEIGQEEAERAAEAELCELQRILNPGEIPVFINADPRGYALKIEDEYMRAHEQTSAIPRDWGGYGIIAPDLSQA